MKYRTKLYISLVAVAFASIMLGLVIFSTEIEKLLLSLLRSRSLSIATTAAVQLDPKLFSKLNQVNSKQDPIYAEALRTLQSIVKVNRRNDIYIEDLYVVYPDPENPTLLRLAIETDDKPNLPGSLYRLSDKNLILKNRNVHFVESDFISDQYGVWLSAYAPIRNANGQYISTLGVAFNAADIHMRLEQIIKYAIWGLSSSLLLSIILAYFLSKKVTKSLDHLCSVVKKIGEGDLEKKSELITNDEFGVLSTRINRMSKGLQERERLKMSFARYVSHHILEEILSSETELHLEGERRKITLLFSDIRHFTRLAESLSPEDVVHLLNEYFEEMIEVIFAHNGILDKFIGDGIMAEFGAPLDDPNQEENAIRAAIEMQKTLHRLCEKWKGENRPQIQMGIGVHTGEAIMGHVGSERRIEYTAIGDSVNVASRLEQATKVLQTPILISESTYLGAKDKFPFKDLGFVALPGRKEQIKAFTVDFGKLS